MPSTGMPADILSSISTSAASAWLSTASCGSPVADVLGEQQFAARRRDHGVDRRRSVSERWSATENAAQLGDLVAPELDAHGMIRGR